MKPSSVCCRIYFRIYLSLHDDDVVVADILISTSTISVTTSQNKQDDESLILIEIFVFIITPTFQSEMELYK